MLCDIILSIFSGFISGIIASGCFTFFLILLKPKIKISNLMCNSKNLDNTMKYTIKIVNKSMAMANNIKYSLYYLEMVNDKMSNVTEIKPKNTPILALDRFNNSKRMEKTHYAIVVSYDVDPIQYPINEKSRFEFVFIANHSISNSTIYIKRQYYNYDIIEGIFEDDDSVNVLCNNDI